ncbi:MAG: hypothetical protein OXC31_15610 [Spirochaetaceae bacterium]|nr:hypothetical protein [Spirochaetaceae bacterium]
MRLKDFSSRAARDTVSSPYRPRKLQEIVHRSAKRFRLIVAHRRFGKSFLCAAECLWAALTLNRHKLRMSPPRYTFVAPTADMAKDLGFDPTIKFLGNWPHKAKRTVPFTITFPSMVDPSVECTITFVGATNIDYQRGRYLDGVVVDEYGEMPGGIWQAVIFPMLADYTGWAMFIGTPKGRNAFYKLYKEALAAVEWDTFFFPAEKTGLIPQEELDTQRKQMGADLFAQEFSLEWMAAVVGTYYGKIINGLQANDRITTVPHSPSHRVFTGWDIGIDDSTAIWWAQRIAGRTNLIDHYEVNNMPLADIVEMVIDKVDIQGRPYTYGNHYFPHDIAQRHVWDGKSVELNLLDAFEGYGHVIMNPKRKVNDGIDAVRRLLKTCYFDARRTSNGLDMLTLYRQKWDPKLGISSGPLKDDSTHSADALRSLADGMPAFKSEPKPGHGADRGLGLSEEELSTVDIMNREGFLNPYEFGSTRLPD